MATYQISISEEQLHGLFDGDQEFRICVSAWQDTACRCRMVYSNKPQAQLR
jgi:hypothetical protein